MRFYKNAWSETLVLLGLYFGLVAPVSAQTCATASLQILSVQQVNLQRYGIAEFTNPSLPPKLYLLENTLDERTYSTRYAQMGTNGGQICSTSIHYLNTMHVADAISYDPVSGASTNDYEGIASVNNYVNTTCTPPFSPSGTYPSEQVGTATIQGSKWSDGGGIISAEMAGWLGPSWGYGNWGSGNGFSPPWDVQGESNVTQTQMNGNWSTTSPSDNLMFNFPLDARYATYTATLSSENSPERLRATMMSLLAPFPAWPPFPSGGTAFMSFADTNLIQASGDKIEYRFEIDNWVPNHIYRFSWCLTTCTISAAGTNTSQSLVGPVEVTPGGDPTQPYYYYPQADEIDMPDVEWPTLSITINPDNVSPLVDITADPPGN